MRSLADRIPAVAREVTASLGLLVFVSLASCEHEARVAPPTSVSFEKVALTKLYISEGASIGDIDADGKPDVVAGPLVWRGPELTLSFAYAPVKPASVTQGYAENFFTFPDRITDDEWTDILKVGLPGTMAQLAVNPGQQPLPTTNSESACTHCDVQPQVCNESPQYIDVIGDGREELIAFSQGYLTLATPTEDPTQPWTVLRVSPHQPKKFQQYQHGLGAGDINGDGRIDLLEKSGWWEQPDSWDGKTPWAFHAFAFAPEQGGAQMFAYDIDGDGDNDVVTALNAHRYGMAWYEQVRDGDRIDFKTHTVMTDKPGGSPYGVCFSQPHAMLCADIDGDGIKDVVTGKCYFAHNGADPGAHDPAVLYWFRTVRHDDGSAELVPYLIDDDSGVGRQITAGDLNGDGKTDIVVANKKGVFAFLQR
jgi:hypothetical protein